MKYREKGVTVAAHGDVSATLLRLYCWTVMVTDITGEGKGDIYWRRSSRIHGSVQVQATVLKSKSKYQDSFKYKYSRFAVYLNPVVQVHVIVLSTIDLYDKKKNLVTDS